MKIKYLGHSCVLVESNGKKVIIDPFLNGNPNCDFKAEDVEVDGILITHGHIDHVGDSIAIARKNNCPIVAENELAMHLAKDGIEIHPLGIGGQFEFSWGKVKLVQSQHGTGIEWGEGNVCGSTPTGFILTMNNKTIYHAGDTGLFGDMKMLGELNEIDVAALPIGDNFTMGIEDSIIAADWLKAKKYIPIHYNTFEVIKQDPNEWLEKMNEKSLPGCILNSGEELAV